jgi:hypothetical protein
VVVSGQTVKARTQATYTVYFHFTAQTASPEWFLQNAPFIALMLAIGAIVSAALAWNVQNKADSDLVRRRRGISQVAFVVTAGLFFLVVLLAFIL